MKLRRQKHGRQVPWTLLQLKTGLEHFYKEHGRYPTATEVDAYPYLPSARSIERRFGGLIELRKELGLAENYDFRTGEHSTRRAKLINDRAHKVEHLVYEYLVQRFGKELVHREYFFTDDHRTRADFFVYDTKKGFCVDVFYPASRRNLTGCLNIKLAKYAGTKHLLDYPIIFLQMNEEITQKVLDELIKRKTKGLTAGQYLMGWDTFQNFCAGRDPVQVLRNRAQMR
jgi:hypothetical protein